MDLIASNLLLILLFVVGTGLVITEAFIPGFGVAGISGIVLEIAAIVLTGSRFGTGPALIALFGVLLVIGLAVFISYRSAMKGRLSRSPLVLKDEEAAAPAADTASLDQWIGKDGIVATPLRPAGFIGIGGARISAATSGAFLEKGTDVRVERTEGDHVIVSRK